MANTCGDLCLVVSIDDRRCEAHTTYTWAGGGAVLTLSTVLPEQGLGAELISTYVGHPATPTIVTHLMLGPVGHAATVHTAEHAPEQVDPVERARECVYDHANQLIEVLRAAGREISVQLSERSFREFERAE